MNLVEACLGECASLLIGIFVDFFFFWIFLWLDFLV